MSDAMSFFGKDFSSTQEKSPKPTETAQAAYKFFGQDFGIPQPKEAPVAPKESVVAPSAPLSSLTVDTIFPRLLKQESGGKHVDEKGNLITSPAGAEGITQLMPQTAKKPGYGIAPVRDKSEEEYLRVGKEYLAKMYEKFGDWEKALAAYNAGVGNVTKAIGKAERFGGGWKQYLPRKEETLPYITNILGGKR